MTLSKRLLVLIAILAIAMGVRLGFFVGCLGTDDMGAWQRAIELSGGNWDKPEQVFNLYASLRFGLILPVTLFFKFFGISEGVASAYPLLMSLVGVASAWGMTLLLTNSVFMAAIVATWLAVLDLNVFLSSVLLPDGPMTALVLLALWCVLKNEISPPKTLMRQRMLLVLGGLAAGFAITTKESAVSFVVAFGVWQLVLVFFKQLKPIRNWLFIGVLAALVVDCSIAYAIYGNPLERFESLVYEYFRDKALIAASGKVSIAHAPIGFITNVWHDLPMTFITCILGIMGVGGVGALMLQKRDVIMKLLLPLTVTICFILSRIPEAFNTFSYQPRRLLPLACFGVIMFATVVMHVFMRRNKTQLASRVVLAVLIIVGLVAARSGEPYGFVETWKDRSALEKGVLSWLQENRKSISNKPIYLDHRTLRIISVLGASTIKSLDLSTYPIYWRVIDGLIVKPTPPLYTPFLSGEIRPYFLSPKHIEHGTVFVNSRYLNFTGGRQTKVTVGQFLSELPSNWEFLDIFSREEFDADNWVTVFRVHTESQKDFRIPVGISSSKRGMGALVAWTALPSLKGDKLIFEFAVNAIRVEKPTTVEVTLKELRWDRRTGHTIGALRLKLTRETRHASKFIPVVRSPNTTYFSVAIRVKGDAEISFLPAYLRSSAEK